ncbi:hypothetical protein CRU92_08180 [Arcobacter sp. FW59]|nr:hypothetical protein CRU92_08180 [Arcobacter sp. FW59]
MRTIQLQVEDKDFESFLTIINNLKKGMIRNFEVKDSDFEQTKSYFNQCLKDIENGNSELLSQEEYSIQMDRFKKNL